MTEWQPIETAPKDGTHILACDRDIMAVLEWHAFPPSIGGGLWSAVGASGYECETDLDKPTHWMPLPPSPHQTESRKD